MTTARLVLLLFEKIGLLSYSKGVADRYLLNHTASIYVIILLEFSCNVSDNLLLWSKYIISVAMYYGRILKSMEGVSQNECAI